MELESNVKSDGDIGWKLHARYVCCGSSCSQFHSLSFIDCVLFLERSVVLQYEKWALFQIFVETVVKNPLTNQNEKIESEIFNSKIDAEVRKHSMFTWFFAILCTRYVCDNFICAE